LNPFPANFSPWRFAFGAHGVVEVGDVLDLVDPQEGFQLGRKGGKVECFLGTINLESNSRKVTELGLEVPTVLLKIKTETLPYSGSRLMGST
jgi:hypothetical protein